MSGLFIFYFVLQGPGGIIDKSVECRCADGIIGNFLGVCDLGGGNSGDMETVPMIDAVLSMNGPKLCMYDTPASS